MTDTLPSWATEKAREIQAAASIGENIVSTCATALHHAYQQGKQDGHGEAAGECDRINDECGMEAGLAASCAAAIRRLDEVQDDA